MGFLPSDRENWDCARVKKVAFRGPTVWPSNSYSMFMFQFAIMKLTGKLKMKRKKDIKNQFALPYPPGKIIIYSQKNPPQYLISWLFIPFQTPGTCVSQLVTLHQKISLKIFLLKVLLYQMELRFLKRRFLTMAHLEVSKLFTQLWWSIKLMNFK